MKVGVPVVGHSFPSTACDFSGRGGNLYVMVRLQIEKIV